MGAEVIGQEAYPAALYGGDLAAVVPQRKGIAEGIGHHLVRISHHNSSEWNGNHRQSREVGALSRARGPRAVFQRITKSRRDAGATKSGLRLAFVCGPAGWGNLCEKCGLGNAQGGSLLPCR